MSESSRQKLSEMHSGEKHWNWKGGRILASGYVFVHAPTHPFRDKHGYIREHRLVMEKHIGRYLTSEEVVHHENKIRTDNRIENLKLFKNKSEHRIYHGRK